MADRGSHRSRITEVGAGAPFLTCMSLCRCDGGNVEVVRILLASQADVNQPDMFNKVLMLLMFTPFAGSR